MKFNKLIIGLGVLGLMSTSCDKAEKQDYTAAPGVATPPAYFAIDRDDEIVLEEDDLDTVTYQDDTIDLDAILLETVYLEIDGECICSDDCKGICIACGKNLNLGPCGCNK